MAVALQLQKRGGESIQFRLDSVSAIFKKARRIIDLPRNGLLYFYVSINRADNK